jgi:hypothetical protein
MSAPAPSGETVEYARGRIKDVRRPSTHDLPAPLRATARAVAERLREHGDRGWIVGGAVRDLALGRSPRDLDMACASPPDAIGAWFDATHAVGRAFGTMVVVVDGVGIQLTTFRKEADYPDGRHPEAVEFGATVEEDAERRDFTANALYLDPLDDTLLDPTGGLADLERGLLRCVGEASRRFTEDGLRLLRMARLAAGYGLEIEAETRAAALALPDALRGVSAERVLAELTELCTRKGAARGAALLLDLGLLEAALPGWSAAVGEPSLRLRVVGRLPDPPGAARGLAALVGPAPGGPASRLLARLRPSRALADAVAELGRCVDAVLGEELPAPDAPGGRAARARLVRRPAWPDASALARAWCDVLRLSPAVLDEVDRFARETDPDALTPDPLLTSADLAASGVERGWRWGRLLARAEDLQLDGVLETREDALRWLASEADADA